MKVVSKFSTNRRLDGKVAIVTGGSDGLGFAIATELVQKGAIVFILSRNQSKLSAAASKLRKYAVPKEFSSNDELSSSLQYKNETVITCQVDLSDLDSVREFIGFYKQKNRRVDILINNAGLITNEVKVSPQGHDLVMATNYLGHFLLAESLLTDSQPTTVINITSDMSSLFGRIDSEHPGQISLNVFQKLLNVNNLVYMNYSYAMAKKAMEMYSQHFMTSLNFSGSSRMFCANPGLLNTNFMSNWPNWMEKLLKPILLRTAMKSPADGVHVVMKCLFLPEVHEQNVNEQFGLVFKGVKSYKSLNYYPDVECEQLYRNTRLLLSQWITDTS